MNHIIVGTAGHVDHGKTCLIKALTGVDTDRLTEEKKRGITIDLGFAEISNDKGLHIGVVDVPGHEKFIKNMLAGTAGMDLVLFVIAADEGIKPQSLEHMEILEALHVDQGIVVLTKTDAVNQERLNSAKTEAEEFLKETILKNAPILEVSSVTGQNIPELKEMICGFAEGWREKNTHPELLRLPVDRVFTVDGFGTVITGTLTQGSAVVGQEVEIYPKRILSRVRNIQVHGRSVERAEAGQRTAVNLSHVKKEDIRRGDFLACPDSLEATKRLDVRIDIFRNSPRRLNSGSRLHFYHGSGELLCNVKLLDKEYLDPGESGYAQITLEEETVACRGDRFVMRFFSPLESMGGGEILDPDPMVRKRFDSQALEGLKRKETGTLPDIAEQFILEEKTGVLASVKIGKRMGLTREETEKILDSLMKTGKVFELANGSMIHQKWMQRLEADVLDILSQHHKGNPMKAGINKEELRKRLSEKRFGMDSRNVDVILNKMAAENKIQLRGNLMAIPDFHVEIPAHLQKRRDEIEQEYLKHGFNPPETREISPMKMNSKETSQIITGLQSQGRLEKLDDSHYIHADFLKEALERLEDYLGSHGTITLAEFRDLLGISRKPAMRILEYADNKKITLLKEGERIRF